MRNVPGFDNINWQKTEELTQDAKKEVLITDLWDFSYFWKSECITDVNKSTRPPNIAKASKHAQLILFYSNANGKEE